jgi:hypothetical protein
MFIVENLRPYFDKLFSQSGVDIFEVLFLVMLSDKSHLKCSLLESRFILHTTHKRCLIYSRYWNENFWMNVIIIMMMTFFFQETSNTNTDVMKDFLIIEDSAKTLLTLVPLISFLQVGALQNFKNKLITINQFPLNSNSKVSKKDKSNKIKIKI